MLKVEISIARRHVYLLLGVAVLAALMVPAATWAADRFVDVPDDSIFHDDIAWLADSDVTRGCNPPVNDEFCPDKYVTREQMAAFLKRLADHQVVDAGEIAGRTATQIGPRAQFFGGQADYSTGQWQVEVEIEAPAAGVLLMAGTVNTPPADDTSCSFSVRLEGGDLDPRSPVGSRTMDDCAITTGFEVPAGTHTVLFHFTSEGWAFPDGWVMWVPFGSGCGIYTGNNCSITRTAP